MPASAPSPRALGAAGRRLLPGRWRCTSRSVRSAPRASAPPFGERGATLRSGDGGRRTAAEDAGPRTGALEPQPQPPPGSETRALAWAAHPGPGPEEGLARARGWRVEGQGARFGARPSGEVWMLRTRCAGARTPCAGHCAEGGFGGAQAGGSPTRPDQSSRRVPGRGSIASVREGARVPRENGGSGWIFNWLERAGAVSVGSCGVLSSRLIGGGNGGSVPAERGDKDGTCACGGRLMYSRAALACASSYSFNKHLWSSPLCLKHCAQFWDKGLHHLTILALVEFTDNYSTCGNDMVELITGYYGNIEDGQSAARAPVCVCVCVC